MTNMSAQLQVSQVGLPTTIGKSQTVGERKADVTRAIYMQRQDRQETAASLKGSFC